MIDSSPSEGRSRCQPAHYCDILRARSSSSGGWPRSGRKGSHTSESAGHRREQASEGAGQDRKPASTMLALRSSVPTPRSKACPRDQIQLMGLAKYIELHARSCIVVLRTQSEMGPVKVVGNDWLPPSWRQESNPGKTRPSRRRLHC